MRPLRVLVAMDKFKGTLTSAEANAAVARALAGALGAGAVRVDACAVSDGGEGFVDALAGALALERERTVVRGPRGAPVAACWAHSAAGARGPPTAYVEMAAASGLALLAPGARDPRATSSHGTGELVRAAWARGYRRVVLGAGGSATNDGGLGALAALGVRVVLDGGATAAPAHVCGATLAHVAALHVPRALAPPGAELVVCCDVRTRLCGPHGATYTFAPQKGAADPAVLAALDAGMRRLARALPHAVDTVDGAGAAGGLAGGLLGALGPRTVRLAPGFPLVAAALRLPARAAAADVVVTGEGALDPTTAHGKAVARIAALARAHARPCVVLCGRHVVAGPASGGACDGGSARECDAAAPGARVVALEDHFPLAECTAHAARCLEAVAREHIVPLCRSLIAGLAAASAPSAAPSVAVPDALV